MRIFGLLFGFLLSILGAVWTFEGWFGAQAGDGFELMVPFLVGPPFLIIGLLLLWISYPRTGPSENDKEDK